MHPGYPTSGPDPRGTPPDPPPDPPPSGPPGYAPGYGQMPPYPDPFSAPPAAVPPAALPPPVDPFAPAYGYDPYASGSGYTVPAGIGAYGPPPSTQNNALGLLAMIFGIISIPMICCYLSVPLGIAGVVLGIIGMRKAAAGQASNRGMALAGVICGGIGGVLGLLLLVGNVLLPLSNLTP